MEWCLSNPCPTEEEQTAPTPAVAMPPGATPFVDDLVPAVTAPAQAPAPAVDDGWASLGFSAAVPAPTPAPAPAPAEPTAQDYLSQLKQQQDASLLMQSNPRDQAYYEGQLAQGAANSLQADAMVAAPPPVAGTVVTPQPSLAANVDPAKVEMLTGLGFSAEQARLALESSGGDADQAANMLFSAA